MNTALLLDIDNTLTPPRQPLNESMAGVLKRLTVPFHVAAGSHLEILQDQFFTPLFEYGFRGKFDAFLSLGGVHYRCDYSRGLSVEVVTAFDLRAHLGEEDYGFLVDTLERTLARGEFRLAPPLKVLGETITCRGAMVNFCPIGRAERESVEYRRNRNDFVVFDRARGYRQRMLEHMRGELARLISERRLSIVLGGETSFDFSVTERDKTYAVRTLLEAGVERLIFIGDALFEGGNDAPIREFAENWPHDTPCPLETVQVNSWQETAKRLVEFGFVSSAAPEPAPTS
ncbi:MAG TPA: hypothetical protein VFA21_11985 [Pyrinomonadaceae bacterium]|nr:hypothetical protein [Pyrinomonadaceae bacterium]